MAEKKEREITRQHHKFQVISHDLVGLKMLYRPLCADCVEEVSDMIADVRTGIRRAWVCPRSGGRWSRNRDQLRQLAKVLSSGGEQELVMRTARASQTKPIETQDALQMREQHLDLLAFTA